MELLFLGTGAADWDIRKADASPDFRRFSSLLADGRLLIDPGPCVYEFEKTFGYDGLYRNVTDVILTHPHGDHFSRETLDKLESSGAVFHKRLPGTRWNSTGTRSAPTPPITGRRKTPSTSRWNRRRTDGGSFTAATARGCSMRRTAPSWNTDESIS